MTTNRGETIIANDRIRSRGLVVALIAIAVVLIDQIVKIWVKTSFYLGEDLPITNWWHLKFIENNGMAFGMELSSKYLLTFGRIIAVIAMIWFASKIIRYFRVRTGFLVALSLVIAGAAGNIFDCIFYGVLFNNPMPPETAVFLPEGGGYAPLFQGRVVDMLYFPLFSFVWPEWVPGVGGTSYEFFQYIFNVADSAICVGVFLIILFYSKDTSEAFAYLSELQSRKKESREK
ncbi:MAG: lipoprotein signal peptidase [Clostridium sp.]|nr:lipoprotein signal peptidase [Prevotella sp.]MCM1429298.1 lipoprotein signal peptidase [Clostridium sp.]MCM1475669.1 lipoprotein signal peptidase [Muribaculaceae bacterium]